MGIEFQYHLPILDFLQDGLPRPKKSPSLACIRSMTSVRTDPEYHVEFMTAFVVTKVTAISFVFSFTQFLSSKFTKFLAFVLKISSET